MITRYLLLIAVLSWLTGCGQCPQCVPDDNKYHDNHYESPFNPPYKVEPNVTTPGGILVDTSGLEVDLVALLDTQTDEVEGCLQNMWRGFTIHREWIIVKIADNAFLSMDQTQELLPGSSQPEQCVAKGLCATVENCTCYLRAGIQENKYIVVTPAFYLYKAELVRFTTSANNPWVEGLAKCALPTVPKLSGLVTATTP